ncbi:la-related protein 7-like [Osmia bicornis bicornis]|uniref:la-related protein 7-like n=1 Tax=Osmia bicornis bicornis TaxID=1437191 RepID=UPI0010F9467E|nr:la-related protein 7-like [Osmia bicornis bicornis]XP_029045173.1 la-related protein 7-like [Osmia bicornis bicornis]
MVMEEQQSDMELDSERVPVPHVQKPIEESHIETVNKVTSTSRGKPRLRKKALHAAILKQMEFYFSDANLTKDRFLNNLIKEDPYVDLRIFLRFNKIRDLTTDINRINKALQASTILSISDDGTKVCRVTPIVQKENIDECTVYVQNLPPDADHETLSSIFSQYGQVVYVSVPRFKNNKKIKGFAFVEFNTPEEAGKCLKAFQKKGCLLPSYTAPDELLSITTFDDMEKDVTLKGKQINSSENCEFIIDNQNAIDIQGLENIEIDKNVKEKEEPVMVTEKGESVIVADSNTTTTTADNHDSSNSDNHENKNKKKARKRKHKDVEFPETVDTEKQSDNESTKSKKKKVKQSSDVNSDEMESSNEKQNDSFTDSIQKKPNKPKKCVSVNEEQVSNDCEEMVTEVNAVPVSEEQENKTKNKKKRKRKKQSKIKDVSYSMGLQVMAKKDWKHLRNKYLELQRSKMKQLKQHLKKARWNQWSNYEKNKADREENDEKDKINKRDNISTCRFSFIPGVIVKVEMDKPCTDPKSFKMELKSNNSVKYIDVENGSYIAYVRCDTSEAAQTFTQKSDKERNMAVLEGEEEKMYWDKILRDREEKLSKTVKIKQRGRNKLLKKAEKELGKHIKFDEV